MPCTVPEDLMARIGGAIVLREAWFDRLLAQVHLADEAKSVDQGSDQSEERLRGVGTGLSRRSVAARRLLAPVGSPANIPQLSFRRLRWCLPPNVADG